MAKTPDPELVYDYPPGSTISVRWKDGTMTRRQGGRLFTVWPTARPRLMHLADQVEDRSERAPP